MTADAGGRPDDHVPGRGWRDRPFVMKLQGGSGVLQLLDHPWVDRALDVWDRHGSVIQKVILAVVAYFLAHATFSLWPLLPAGQIALAAMGVAALSWWSPPVSVVIFLIVLTPSMALVTGGLMITFGLSALLAALVVLDEDAMRVRIRQLLFMASPLAFLHNLFLFPAVAAGLTLGGRSRGVSLAVITGAFGLVVAYVAGAGVPGVFPAHTSLIIPVSPTVPLATWLASHLTHPNWPVTVRLVRRFGVFALAGAGSIAVLGLICYVAAVMRRLGRAYTVAVAAALADGAGVVGLAATAHGFSPNPGVAFRLIPAGVESGVLAWGVGSVFPPGEYSSERLPFQRLRRATWDDLAGYENIKKELREAIDPYVNPHVRRDLERRSLPIVRGILLYGPPGTGKTLMARVLASEAKMHLVSVSGPEFFSQWVGESERKLRELFREGRAHAPSLLFFDEIESFLPPREQVGTDSDSGHVSHGVVATFLAEMDGLLERGNVLVVAATNHPDRMDSAALRPGRFDKVIYVPPPDAAARLAILTQALAHHPVPQPINAHALVALTERFTAADIVGVVAGAYRTAAQRKAAVTETQLEGLFKSTKPTVSLAMLENYARLEEQYGRRSDVVARAEVLDRPKLTWDDIAGLDRVKTAIREAVELPLVHPELFAAWGVTPHKGVLLYGPPGCGKTLFAKVVADVAGVAFYTVNGPEILGGGPGRAEARLRQLFQRAQENRPAIIFFDELDAIATSRESVEATIQGPVVQQLLTLMDGKEPTDGVVVMAATNRPAVLDAALLRPGRFDQLIYIPLPDAASRQSQWRLQLGDKPGGDTIDYQRLATSSEGLSGAEIRYVANAVAMQKLRVALVESGDAPKMETVEVLAALSAFTPETTPEMSAAFDQIALSMRR